MTSMRTRLEIEMQAGLLTYSAIRFSILATRFGVAESFPDAAESFPGLIVDAIMSEVIIAAPELIIVPAIEACAVPRDARFNSFSCSLSNVISWGPSFLKYSTTLAETPVPVTSTWLTSSRPCPPSLV